MKIAVITRSTLYTVKGGDTFQIINTARQLKSLGIDVDIKLTNQPVQYQQYDLLHFFNIVRPADIVCHINQSKKPFVVSPNLVNYHEYDRLYRKGLAGKMFRFLPRNSIEYIKTIARWMQGNDVLATRSYLWHGHKQSIKKILQQAARILPNSKMEYDQLAEFATPLPDYSLIPNGIDPAIFSGSSQIPKDPDLVLCVARIEGLKNQLNLIKALNNTRYRLVVIGNPAPNQVNYYEECRKQAASNISFINHLPQEDLRNWYQKAAIHVLPSWFETCGLSTLEAAAMGCRVVITDKGYTREYFGNEAAYCDPASPQSMLAAVEQVASSSGTDVLQKKIFEQYTWQQAASKTAVAYKQVLQ
ncbi:MULTISPECIES: glycosyltransferase family 4 protein [Niastella]|uniref:Glycosyltransferase family 4 protein n=1 Tax=Niastella soli TaxID=2821487 RepID=A0ABS3YMB8_9BACT|nr:glycosyltransferase family 4 protein [Niastella soli]MBO9199023.1 glycosyltransferase family 4 protein [Niastella soli]